MTKPLFLKISLSLFISFIFATTAWSQSGGGINSILDDMNGQSDSSNEIHQISQSMNRMEQACYQGVDFSSSSARGQKYCGCFARLMTLKFSGPKHEYYARMLEGIGQVRERNITENQMLLETAQYAVNNGLNQQDVAYVRREAKARMNYAAAHLKYGDACQAF